MTFTPPVRRINAGRGHRYVDANGTRVPGVTTIIGDGLPKEALINWAAEATAAYAVDHFDELADMKPAARLKVLNKARYADRAAGAARGTAVHRLAEKLIAGKEVEIPDDIAGYVESYVKFLDEWDVEAVLVEFPVVSYRHGYAGTGDLIADLRAPDGNGRQRALLDTKTSRSGVFGETALQLAGYRYADVYLDGGVERPVPPVDWTGAVHIRADGYSLIPVTAGLEQHRALLYVQQVAGFVDNSRDLVGEQLIPPTGSAYRLTRQEPTP